MAVDPPRLPAELVEVVLQQAWLTIDAAGRWPLCQAVSCVSWQWRNITVNTILRYIVVETPLDIEMYRKLRLRHRVVCALIGQRAHLRMDLDHRMNIFLGSPWRSISSSGYGTTITQIVPDCKSLHVLLNLSPLLNSDYSPYHALFECLAKFRSLQSLYLYWPDVYIGRCLSPPISIRTVTYLRIHEYPRCTCNPVHEQQLYGMPAASECFHYYLPTLFPALRHLHFDKPCILKRLTHPPTLELLTLEAPPCHYMPSRGFFSSLMGWNIVSALLAGFLKRERRAHPRRKIIVNSGVDEPDGFQRALAACTEHDILLERRSVYAYPG